MKVKLADEHQTPGRVNRKHAKGIKLGTTRVHECCTCLCVVAKEAVFDAVLRNWK